MSDPPPAAAQVEAAIHHLLARRPAGATICPSEAARAVAGEEFRAIMPLTREVAAHLADTGAIEVTQRGEPVDLRSARGPVRLRRSGGRRAPASRPPPGADPR